MNDKRSYTAENAKFWEERGARADRAGHEVTLMAEHPRYVAYIHEREVHLLKRLIGDTKPRVLDVGCGAGRLSLAIAPLCKEVVGVDIAGSLIERARTAARTERIDNAEFHQGGLDAPFGFGAFDMVLLSGVLNCLDDGDAEAALGHCVASLRPGGTFYMRNNCAVKTRIYRPGTAEIPPNIHRTGAEYVTMVRGAPGLALTESGFLFPPICAPNMVYYHALPKGLRDTGPVKAALNSWFSLESATADARLKWLTPAYGPIIQAMGKKTVLHVVVAQRV